MLFFLPLFAAAAVGSVQQPIVGGKNHDGDPAIVLLELADGGYCTGTLISPRVVLTAAHCLEGDPNEIVVKFSKDARDFGPALSGRAATIAPKSDLGALALAQPVTDVVPMPWNDSRARLAQAEGARVRLVGYGSTGEELVDYGRKREGFSVIEFLGERSALLGSDELGTKTGGQSTCYGDSGGPTLVRLDGVETVIGVNSRGTEACGAGVDIAVRTDVYADFLFEFLQEHDPDFCASGACEPNQGGGCQSGGGGGFFAVFLALCLVTTGRGMARHRSHC